MKEYQILQSKKEKTKNIYQSELNKFLKENNIIVIKEKILSEGGNLTVDGKDGPKDATKLRVSEMTPENFEEFKKDFIDFLISINNKFKDKNGYPIWNDLNSLKSGEFFSGSTRAMFQQPFEEYIKYKKRVGDFDVQVPGNIKDDFYEFLSNDLNGQTINGFEIYGIKKEDTGSQDHCLVRFDSKYKNVGAEFCQIDFEYVTFDNDKNKPTEFSKFAHYSSWEDIQNDIKGVFQKYLLASMIGASMIKDIVIVSPKIGRPLASLNKDRFKTMLAFSADKGVRIKYAPYTDQNGDIVIIDGQEAYYKLDTKDSIYTTSLDEIFTMIFKHEPSEEEKHDLYSFVRTLKLMNKEMDRDQILKVAKRFIGFTYDLGTQKLSKDINEDMNWKNSVWNVFFKIFPFIKKELGNGIEEKKNLYYKGFYLNNGKRNKIHK